jgi:formamidopyrimidine-DNA glycosylase
MPELPEVETVRRGLAPALVGRRLVRVEARRPDLRFPLPERFAARLEGAQVIALDRRAKYLIAALDTGEALLAHLGMSGRFSVEGAPSVDTLYFAAPLNPKHTHVVFETDIGVRIEYNDPRRFGYMDIIGLHEIENHAFFKNLGPEPLSLQFDARHLAAALAGRRQAIKVLLLDQRIVSGLGNIYVCEALFRARIAPETPSGTLALPRLRRLVAAIRQVLGEAIDAGGSSLRDHASVDGALGYFQHRFAVYDREGKACPTCAHPIQRTVQGGRSTFFCARCQR